MKNIKSILTAIILVIAVNSLNAKNIFTVTPATEVTDTVTVYGNCNMCKGHIETALKDVDGIKKATWSHDTNLLTVTYDKDKITLLKIEQLVADAGYDTIHVTAPKEKYDALPGCCKYERVTK